MLKAVLSWVVSAIIIMLTAYFVPGISVAGFWTALLVVAVITLINIFIRPFIMYISLPINIITLGLFTLVINALLFMLTAKIVSGFSVDDFWPALAGSVMAQNSKARMKNCRIIVRVFNFAKVSIIVQISSRMILANQLFFNMCITFQKFAVILPSKHHHFVTISLYDSFGFRLEKPFRHTLRRLRHRPPEALRWCRRHRPA